MTKLSWNRGRLGLFLAGLCVSVIAGQGRADEMNYLPDNPQAIASVNLRAPVKSETFRKVLTGIRQTRGDFHPEVGRVARITAAANPDFRGTVVVVTPVRPIAVGAFKAMQKPGKHQHNFALKEIKHRTVTIFQETWQEEIIEPSSPDGKPGKKKYDGWATGRSFFIAEGKYLVCVDHQVDLLKKIIDRGGKAPKLSPPMQAALKAANFKDAAFLAVDLHNLPDLDRDLFNDFSPLAFAKRLKTFPEVKAEVGKLQAAAISLNEPGMIKASVTLVCSGPKGATVALDLVNRSWLELKTIFAKEEPKERKEERAIRTILNAVKLSSIGSTMTTSVEVSPAIVNDLIGRYLEEMNSPPERTQPVPPDPIKDDLSADPAVPAPAKGAELRYLPNNADIIVSVDLTAARNTKTMAEVTKHFLKQKGPNQDDFLKKILATNARITFGSSKDMKDAVFVVTTPRPLTLANIGAWIGSLDPNAKGPVPAEAFKKIKRGSATFYKMEGMPTIFFIDGNHLVLGLDLTVHPDFWAKAEMQIVDHLEKVVDRKAPAKLSPAVAAGLKRAGLDSTVSLVVDFKFMSEDDKKNVVELLQMATKADIKGNAKKAKSVAVSLNEKGGMCQVTVSLACDSPAAAVILKGIAQRSFADAVTKVDKMFLKAENPRPEDVRLFKTFKAHLESIKVSTDGNLVTASTAIEPAAVMDTVTSWQGFFMAIAFDAATNKK